MKRDGIALVTVLLVVVVVGILTTGSLLLSVSNLRLSKNDATSTQALAVAQAGSAFWRAELVSLYVYMLEHFDLYEDDIQEYIDAGNQITCGNYLAIGVDTDRDGEPDVRQGEALPVLEVPFSAGGPLGSATVTFSTRGSAIVLDARSTFASARARVVDEFSVSTVDVWNNAVFAGNSAANATINGRAEIRGSVHVLGDGLSSTEMALDITGSFGLGNTYKGVSSSLGLDTMQLTTEDPFDLCATLRAKKGYVQMDGSSNIGYTEASQTDQHVDNVLGIYTNHGIRGGTLGSNVFSLNGMTAPYDAGNSFQFPRLDDTNPKTLASWRTGLEEHALVLGPNADDRRNQSIARGRMNASEGDTFLTASCFASDLFGSNETGMSGSFVLEFYNQSRGTPDFHCAKGIAGTSPENDVILSEVKWTRTTNELYVGGTAGVINFRGADLLITGTNATDKQIAYKGEGILFAEDALGEYGGSGGNIRLEVDFLPATGKAAVIDANGNLVDDPDAPANTYPATAIVALVADKNVTSTGAQKRFTTAIYAEESVNIEQQTLVAGSIVTKTFDAGSQVPTVLYVPNLAERLSDLMPGTGSQIYAVSNVAYSRR